MNKIKVNNEMKMYEYDLGNGNYCAFIVHQSGLIYAKIRSRNVDFDKVVNYFRQVSETVKKSGKKPQIDIKRKNAYLKCLAYRCGYKKGIAKGVSFDIWTYE